MDNRMLVLWATPRSTSTAFEWMMRQRGDFRTLHEPFGVPYYRGADRRTTRFDENPQDLTITYESTWADIRREHRKGRVFMKDFPNYVIHMADGTFLDHFQHTFLVRHPAKALPSMYHHWSTFTMDECSYQALHEMFERVSARYDEAPVVIESDDLVDDPYRTVEAYCKAVGIPFLPEALEWAEGERSEVTWYGGTWHEGLQGSTGLRRQESRYPSPDEVPFLKEMVERCLPHYEAIAKHRL